MRLLHRIFKGHWPEYKSLQDEMYFDYKSDICSVCLEEGK